MEAVSNLAGAAQKAIFGNGVVADDAGTNQEPVAGAQGAGTANDPFDKGNEADNQSKDGPSDSKPDESIGDPSSGQTGAVGSDRNQAADAATKDPDSQTQDYGSKDDKGNLKMPHSDEEREKLMEKGEFPHDPNDHSGEPLKMHSQGPSGDDSTGDAAAAAEEGGDGEKKKDRKDSVAQEGGDPHGEKKGDGTKVVKASGLAADGGDFDAANPGAGSEANRLLESKGVHKSGGPAADTTDDSGPSAPDSGADAKGSKLQKIKDKLHIS